MKLKVQAYEPTGKRFMFWCPGCQNTHYFWVGVPGQPSWSFDGNMEHPTFSPSLIERSGHYCTYHKPGADCWCTYEARYGKKPPFTCYVCHLFLKDGRLQFLPDCTHALAGQTVELPDLPDRLAGKE